MASGMSLWQFRVSRHVPIILAYQALQQKYGRGLPSDETYEQFEKQATTTGAGSNRHWGGLSVRDIENVIEIEHISMKARGLYPTAAEVRASLRQAKRDGGLSLAGEVVRLAMDQGKPEVAARFDSEAFMVAGLRPRVPAVDEEEFRAFWVDASISLGEVLAAFSLGTMECERLARELGLAWPKPYDDPKDDRPNPKLDGLTAAQRHNSAYRESSDEMRIAVARWCEERKVDRNKLLRIYETQPTARCVGWMGGHSQFYVALGVFDIPLRRGGRYAAVDHPEDFPPEPDPRDRRDTPSGPPPGARRSVVITADAAAERVEQRQTIEAAARQEALEGSPAPEPVAASPAPAPQATEPAHVAPTPTYARGADGVPPIRAAYSVDGLAAERDELVARRVALTGEMVAAREALARAEAEDAQIELRLETVNKAIDVLRTLEEGLV